MSAWLGSRDPQPRSREGELALLVLSGVLFMLGVGALTGLGAAAALFGGGWVWPDGSDTIGRTLGGLLTGHPGAGLPPQLQARVPGPAVVYRCVAVTELAALIVSVTAGVVWWRYRRPNDARRGMATRAEATRVLGRSRLRGARTILRPDLYGTTSRASKASKADR